ncbi:MAG: DUF1292 domain-containing protein [Erysipelotrichaceae bacterium]|nr:DUF1292 domain-containing protein [Erysipelotrichaceae bacterium]
MENRIYITNEDGKEIEMNILFTFDMEDKNYVVVYENGNEDDLYAFEYDSKGNLTAIEDEKTLEKVQEVIDAFDGIDDEEIN